MLANRTIKAGTRSFTFVMGLFAMQVALGVDVLLPALPAMVRDLGMTPEQAQLMVGTYIGGIAAGQIIWGWLADSLGRRPILIIGCVVYALASLLCGLTESGEAILMLRFAQGMFGSATVTASRAIVRDKFTGVMAARQIASISSIFYLTPLLAPQLGTLLVMYSDWRSVFWVPAILGAVSLWIVLRHVEETHPVESRRLASFMEIIRTWWQMIRHPMTGLCIAINAAMSIGLFFWISSSSLVLTGYFGVPEHLFGLLFSVTAVMQLAGTILCNRLLRNGKPARVLAIGAALCMAGGLSSFTFTFFVDGTLWMVMPGIWAFMLGFGLIVPSSSGLALHPFGHASGLAAAGIGTIQSLTGSVGSALNSVLFDGTFFSLGLGMSLSALLTMLAAATLGVRLHRRPELYDR